MEYKAKQLKQIALINLNKDGSSNVQSNNKYVTERAIADKELLKKQINLYDPEIIICGSKSPVGVFYKKYIGNKVNPSIKPIINQSENCYVEGYVDISGKIILITYHPAYGKAEETYSYLIDIICQLREKLLTLEQQRG